MSPAPITAVMLTRPSREGMALRAAVDFFSQASVGDDLLLLSYTPDRDADAVLRRSGGSQFRVTAEFAEPADMLRDAVAQAKARGGLFAVWDDDNRYHPLKLARQAAAVAVHRQPCFVSSAIWQYHDSGEVFLYEMERRHLPLQTRVLLSSLVCGVEHLDADLHPAAALTGGGSPTARFGAAVLGKNNAVARVTGEWWWTVVGVRGDNAAGYEEHRRHSADGQRCANRAWLRERESLVRFWMDQYVWDAPPDGLAVCGHDGVAFQFSPARREDDPLLPPIGEPQGVVRVREVVEEQTPNG